MKLFIFILLALLLTFNSLHAGNQNEKDQNEEGITTWVNGQLNRTANGINLPQSASLNSRDPFAVSGLMLKLAQGLKKSQQDGFTALALGDTKGKVPKLHLNGFLTHDNTTMALLKIQGAGTFLIKEGDTLSLQALGQDTVLKIETIKQQSVLVKVGTLGQQIIVR